MESGADVGLPNKWGRSGGGNLKNWDWVGLPMGLSKVLFDPQCQG